MSVSQQNWCIFNLREMFTKVANGLVSPFISRTQRMKMLADAKDTGRKQRTQGRSEIFLSYSMTLSARSSTNGGMMMFNILAALILTTSSNLVGCSTAMSAGFAPLSTLSTK